MDRGTSTGTRARLHNRFCPSGPVDWNDPMVFDWQVGKVDIGASRVQNGSLQLHVLLPLDDVVPFQLAGRNVSMRTLQGSPRRRYSDTMATSEIRGPAD